MKATKATVTIGHVQIDGYLTDSGIFGMSTAGLGALCGFTRTESTSAIKRNKKVKALEAKGFEAYANVSCENMRITLISIEWVPAILSCFAVSGNAEAEAMMMTFAGLSLQKLFCDAFGQKFDTQEMQEWLQVRTQGIEKRNQWTDAIKAYGETHSVSDTWKRFIYCNVSDRLNTALTGHKAKYWCDLLNCSTGTLRDNWKPSHLSNVDAIERYATVLVIKGAEPMEALEKAIDFYGLEVNRQPQRSATKAALRLRAKRGSKLPLE